ncbi:zinc finger protein 778-like isoform X1 [Cheilinus undulatus]|uniref:zinc finger protein 778-like isoform X1 n=1 Tax=Cheilinus undulatus TaxID=241271 RepID=UPI001BD46651|nr:zinc finger protein 778-like isoform X1 [Cheilinus undulatus]
MANVTLQSFNVFLTEKLTAAAVDIYGFVEKTIIDYQDEVYRTKLENQRLQRLLDLVYKPEIRLHRADTRQIDLPTPTQEVCAQEQQTQKQCFLSEEEPATLPFEEEQTEPWNKPEETPVCSAYSSMTDSLAQMVKVGESIENKMHDDLTEIVTVGDQSDTEPDNLIQVVTVGEHLQYEMPLQEEQPLPSYRVSSAYTRKKNMFFCNICGKPFGKKENLKLHIAAHSTRRFPKFNNRTFTCCLCNKTTYTKYHMLTHMKSHNTEKPYPCPICGNRYKLKSHVKEHIRTHTGERPYTCYICGLGFNRSSTLSKHARSIHGENKPFKCEQCDLRFPLYIVLKQHMRTVHDVHFPVGDEQPLEQQTQSIQ